MSSAESIPTNTWKIISPGIPYEKPDHTHEFPKYPRQYEVIQCKLCSKFYKAVARNYKDGIWSNFYWIPCDETGRTANMAEEVR